MLTYLKYLIIYLMTYLMICGQAMPIAEAWEQLQTSINNS